MTAGGSVCVMGTALGTMPSTGGWRPPVGKLATPGGYLENKEGGKSSQYTAGSHINSADGVGAQCLDVVCVETDGQ